MDEGFLLAFLVSADDKLAALVIEKDGAPRTLIEMLELAAIAASRE